MEVDPEEFEEDEYVDDEDDDSFESEDDEGDLYDGCEIHGVPHGMVCIACAGAAADQ